MPKLYFYYGSMNAGKSAHLLQAQHNYAEKGLKTYIFLPEIIGLDKVTSRTGMERIAEVFPYNFNFRKFVERTDLRIDCIFIDEAQFLTYQQVQQLCAIVDDFQIPIMCYGLRTDFLGNAFEGSRSLLSMADELREIKSICKCGKKATMNAKISYAEDGTQVIETSGNQIDIGQNKYVSFCRKCFTQNTKDIKSELV